MAKAKKKTVRLPSPRRIPMRLMDALVILFVGAFGSLSLYLYQDLRKDVNVLLQNEQTFKTQVAPAISQELGDLRNSLRDLNVKLSARKMSPAAPAKRKRSVQNDNIDGDENSLASDIDSSEILKLINEKYVTIDGVTQAWDPRAPASVPADESGKNMRWVLSQIGLCFSWMLVIGSIVLLILKLVESSARSKNNGHDQF
jgi:hypothetical protein